jgi:hypothetical protein
MNQQASMPVRRKMLWKSGLSADLNPELLIAHNEKGLHYFGCSYF